MRIPSWYCCLCGDGPKLETLQVSCTACGHQACSYCIREGALRLKPGSPADDETVNSSARTRATDIEPRQAELSSIATSTTQGSTQGKTPLSPVGNAEPPNTEPNSRKLATKDRKHRIGFVCPVFLHDQSRGGITPKGRRSRACEDPWGIPRARDVKSHLLNQKRTLHEGITEEQREKITKVKSNRKIKTEKEREEEYVRELHRILFPGETIPTLYGRQEVWVDDDDSATVSTTSDLDEEDQFLYQHIRSAENEKLKTCCKKSIKKAIPRFKNGIEEMQKKNKELLQLHNIGSSSSNSFPAQSTQSLELPVKHIGGAFSSQPANFMVPTYRTLSTATSDTTHMPAEQLEDPGWAMRELSEPFSSGPEDINQLDVAISGPDQMDMDFGPAELLSLVPPALPPIE